MTVSNTASVSAPVNRKLSTKFIKDVRPRCHYFVGSRPGDVMPAHNGTYTMLFRQYDNLTPTTTALTEVTGTLGMPTRAGTEIGVTDTTMTVQKYGAHAFLTEELTLRDVTAAGMEIVEVFSVQGGRSLNRLQRNVVEDNLSMIYEGGGAADNTVNAAPSIGTLESAINTLDRSYAEPFMPASNGSRNVGTLPVLEAYWAFMHSDVAAAVAKLTGFISVERYAGHTATAPGEFGAIQLAGKGVRCISTAEASIDTGVGKAGEGVRVTSGVADLYTTVIIGKNCHGALSLDENLVRESYKAGDRIPGLQMIETAMGSAGSGDPMQEVKSIGWKAWHGGGILKSEYGVAIRSAAPKLAA